MLRLPDLQEKLPLSLFLLRITCTVNGSVCVPEKTDLTEVSGLFRFMFSSWLNHLHTIWVKVNKTRCVLGSLTHPFLTLFRTFLMMHLHGTDCPSRWVLQVKFNYFIMFKPAHLSLPQVHILIWNPTTGILLEISLVRAWTVRCCSGCWSCGHRKAVTSHLHTFTDAEGDFRAPRSAWLFSHCNWAC